MAAEYLFGPVPPHYRARFSISSSSSQTSPSSSESPPTSSTLDFHYVSESSVDNVVPKIEELDDDDMDGSKISPITDESVSPAERTVAKRPRGRPRKHPLTQTTSIAKGPKGRSKTGCITCRRRKKKCDETKPACLHCQKNNVHCEGYPPKEFWKSGRQRTTVPVRRGSFVPRELPFMITGVETEVDREFLHHFSNNVSRVLSLFTEQNNPFTDLLIPMAIRHRGLMHSLLCLSGSHLLMLKRTPDYEDRQNHHFQCAIRILATDQGMQKRISGDDTALIEDPTVAQTLILCLKSVTAGEVDGSYRPHMDAARHLIRHQKSDNVDFQNFLVEFFIYHDVANSVTSLDRTSVLMMEDFQLPEFMIQPEAASLLGVVDGLFGLISSIRKLRDRIREKRQRKVEPPVDYTILGDAVILEKELREWSCRQEEYTARWFAAKLYQQCTWIYLYRSIMPSKPNDNLKDGVDLGLYYLSQLPPDSHTQSVLLMPLFLLGCAAFEPEQRPPVSKAFEGLQEYSNLGNIPHAREIVHTVWEMMDAGNEESWDWETIITNKGWDFLVT